MLRPALTALAGAAMGVVGTALLLWLTSGVLDWKRSQTFQIDHGVIYLCLTLGGGFGALSGAVVGLLPPSRPPKSG